MSEDVKTRIGDLFKAGKRPVQVYAELTAEVGEGADDFKEEVRSAIQLIWPLLRKNSPRKHARKHRRV